MVMQWKRSERVHCVPTQSQSEMTSFILQNQFDGNYRVRKCTSFAKQTSAEEDITVWYLIDVCESHGETFQGKQEEENKKIKDFFGFKYS